MFRPFWWPVSLMGVIGGTLVVFYIFFFLRSLSCLGEGWSDTFCKVGGFAAFIGIFIFSAGTIVSIFLYIFLRQFIAPKVLRIQNDLILDIVVFILTIVVTVISSSLLLRQLDTSAKADEEIGKKKHQAQVEATLRQLPFTVYRAIYAPPETESLSYTIRDYFFTDETPEISALILDPSNSNMGMEIREGVLRKDGDCPYVYLEGNFDLGRDQCALVAKTDKGFSVYQYEKKAYPTYRYSSTFVRTPNLATAIENTVIVFKFSPTKNTSLTDYQIQEVVKMIDSMYPLSVDELIAQSNPSDNL